MCEIRHNARGYWTMMIDGIFVGNYDSYGEARREAEALEEGVEC